MGLKVPNKKGYKKGAEDAKSSKFFDYMMDDYAKLAKEGQLRQILFIFKAILESDDIGAKRRVMAILAHRAGDLSVRFVVN